MTIKRFLFFIFIGFTISTSSLIAQSNKQKALEKQRLQKERELKQINALLFSKQKEEKSELTYIEDLNYKIRVRKNLIRITNQQANLLTKSINTNQKEISNLRNQLDELKADYAAMIVKSYKSRSEQSKVMFLLSSNNFKQAYKRLQYIKQYANYQKKQGILIKAKTKDLQNLNIRLTKQKREKKKLIEENNNDKRELEQEVTLHKSIMASIKSNMGKYTAQIKHKKQEIAEIDKEIDRLIKESIAASHKKSGQKSATGKFILTPANKKLAANFEANKGKLGWPVSRGVIKGRFGKRRSLIDKSVTQNYKSIYIATEVNAKVKAVFNGEVSGVLVVKNGNPAVMIRHGNYLTVYMNLSKIYVKKGDKISTNQVIGEVFTNKAKGSTFLGFRVYKNNLVLNPEYWLAKH